MVVKGQVETEHLLITLQAPGALFCFAGFSSSGCEVHQGAPLSLS